MPYFYKSKKGVAMKNLGLKLALAVFMQIVNGMVLYLAYSHTKVEQAGGIDTVNTLFVVMVLLFVAKLNLMTARFMKQGLPETETETVGA